MFFIHIVKCSERVVVSQAVLLLIWSRLKMSFPVGGKPVGRGIMKSSSILALVFSVMIVFVPAQAEACARTQSQLAAMLPGLGVDGAWARFIEGHWAKKAGGTGWHVVYYKSRLAFAVQNPITRAKDAQFIEICPSSEGNDFTVRGTILGRSQNLEVKVHGRDLKVMNGLAKGVFKKRNKSRSQIVQEFSAYFSEL